MQDPRVDVLLENLDRAFDRRSWHGPNFMGSIRGLGPDEAAWRPQPGRHNIWEYVVHAAYWKYRIVRLIDSQAAPGFDLSGSNFFDRPIEPTKRALTEDVRLLKSWHARLRDAVESIEPFALAESPGRAEFTREALILGAATHDVYHAGQIRLVRRIWGDRAEN